MVRKRTYSRSSYKPIGRDEFISDFAKISITVCIFVALREFRPVEPFLTSYLNSPPLNFTTEQVNEEIYPMGMYFSFVLAVVVFLITDWLRYKPIIILDGITGILTYALLLGIPSMDLMRLEQLCYGFFYSSEVACNTYLYAKVDDTSQYQKISGFVRSASLIGRFVSGIFSQVTVSFKILEKYYLIYLSVTGMVLATIWSFFIPSVDRSLYFHRSQKNLVTDGEKIEKQQTVNENTDIVHDEAAVINSANCSMVAVYLLEDFKKAYTNPYVLKWSFWWAFCLCGYFFVTTYSQLLWQIVAKETGLVNALMNGAIESVYTITSALAAYGISFLKLNWRSVGDSVLVFATIFMSASVLYMQESASLWMIYIAYVCFGITFQTMLIIAQSEVAQQIEKDSYALIFGFNSFVALALSSILTFLVTSGNVFNFTIRQQFSFYGLSFAIIALVLLMKIILSNLKCKIHASHDL